MFCGVLVLQCRAWFQAQISQPYAKTSLAQKLLRLFAACCSLPALAEPEPQVIVKLRGDSTLASKQALAALITATAWRRLPAQAARRRMAPGAVWRAPGHELRALAAKLRNKRMSSLPSRTG